MRLKFYSGVIVAFSALSIQVVLALKLPDANHVNQCNIEDESFLAQTDAEFIDLITDTI